MASRSDIRSGVLWSKRVVSSATMTGPLEGPDAVLHLLKHMLRFGGSRLFRKVVPRTSRGSEDRKDRTCHKLETMTEVIMPDGAYDQLNMKSLMSCKKESRRLQHIVEAHAEVGQAPSWKMARYYNEAATLTDVVSPALRQCGTRRAKEEAEVGALASGSCRVSE